MANSQKEGALCSPHYQKKYRGLDPEQYKIYSSGKTVKSCLRKGCDLAAVRSQMCTKHFTAVMTGKLQGPAGMDIKLSQHCAHPPCTNRARSYKNGALCQTHYVQRSRGIDLMSAERWGQYARGEVACVVPKCDSPAKTRELCKNHYPMLKTYGIDRDELIRLMAVEKCSNPGCANEAKLHIDHDHATGLVRDMLCPGCNAALGHVHESPERLRGLAEYVEKHLALAPGPATD